MYCFLRGIGLIEIIIASAVIITTIVALLGLVHFSLVQMEHNLRRAQAAYLAEEGLEVVRYFRDQGWANISDLTASQVYYLTFSEGAPGSWATTTVAGSPIAGIFTRTFSVFDVERSGSDDIVASGGVVDSNTRRARITISWQDQKGPQQLILETYLTNAVP